MARRRPRTAWQIAYDQELSASLLSRSRWSIALALAISLVASLHLEFASTSQMAARREFLHTLITLIAIVGLISFLPVGRRNPRAVSFGLGLSLTLALTGYPFLIPHGLPIAGASLSMVVMGLAVLLPWGMAPQIVLGAVATVEFATVTWFQPQPLNSGLLSVVMSGAIVGVIGAALLDRYRRDAHERVWQQAHLAAMGQDLARTQDPAVAGEHLVRHGLALIPASLCLIAQRVAQTERYRVTHIAGPLRSRFETLLGFETPVDSPLAREIGLRGVLTMPQDAPDTELGQIFATLPGVSGLYVSLDHSDAPVGVLAWIRRDAVPFLAAEAQLARDVGAQAALAIKTTQAIADLRRMNRLKSDFVSTVSHELRTPLNVILGYTEMVRDCAFTDADRFAHLNRIEGAGRELLTLIESTLEVGRLDADQSPVRLERFGLAEFWGDVRETCATIPHAEEVEVRWSDLPAVQVTTDPHKLKVIARNLIGNALKFTERGRVDVRLEHRDDHLLLAVSDTGIGIHPDDHRVIFELFRQADSSDARRFEGTGLGLHIVQRFVEQLGGHIALESAPGEGSRFTVTVPVAAAAEGTASHAA